MNTGAATLTSTGLLHMIVRHGAGEAHLVGLLDERRLAVRIAKLLSDGNEDHLAHGTIDVILLGKAVVDPGSCCCDATERRVCTQLTRGDGLKVHHADGDELGCELAADVLNLVGEPWANVLEDGADNLVLGVDVG